MEMYGGAILVLQVEQSKLVLFAGRFISLIQLGTGQVNSSAHNLS